jgi:hypothetical protein
MAGVEAGVMLPYTKNPAVANLPAAYPSPSFADLEGLEAQRPRRPSRSSPSRFDAMPLRAASYEKSAVAHRHGE